jgi:uncharacterized tellurite resistance protein B-like protein
MQRFKGQVEPAQPKHDPLRLAAATMLLDIAYADGDFSLAEGGDVVDYLRKAFRLDEPDTQDLIRTADEFRNQTIDHFAVANFVRRSMPLEQRIEIVKTMWRVALADGRLTDYEHYLVRKLADLLGLEHHVMIDAKVAVLNES